MAVESSVFLQAIIAVSLLLFAAKLLAELFARFHLPVVLAELGAGILLGPLYFGGLVQIETRIFEVNEIVLAFGEVGAIVILFVAGLEVPFREFIRGGVASFTTGALGVVAPFLGGYLLFTLLGFNAPTALIVATALTATSIAISVETLRELGRLNTQEAKLIIGAAVVDDILAIAVLSAVVSLIRGEGSSIDPIGVASIVGQVLLLFAALLGASVLVVPRLTTPRMWRTHGSVEAVVTASFFGMAAVAATIGLSPIVGAFAAGMALAGARIGEIMHDYVEKLQFLFRPLFFAVIGAQVNLAGITTEVALIGAGLIIIAIATKLVGCGLPAALFLKNRDRGWTVGVAMVSRGEVGLIVAGLAITAGVILPEIYTILVLMIVTTTIVTPLWLKRTVS